MSQGGNNDKSFIDVSPDMQFYNLLESYHYSIAKALSEYIDNALQAFIDETQTEKAILTMTIEFNMLNSPFIIIKDDGVGITRENFQNALKPAKRKPVASLSEFGIGMKAASLWFGRQWSLLSTPCDEDESYKINFDLDRLLSDNDNKIPLDVLSRETDTGVLITLQKLRREISREQVENAWSQLQEIYQLFTYSETPLLRLILKYNGVSLPSKSDEILKYRNPTILNFPLVKTLKSTYYAIGEPKKWEQSINFTFESNNIRGSLVVLETSSQKRNPGIRLYRNNRLIKGFFDAPYRPISLVGTGNKHAPSRIFGELHLDGQAISHSKGDFTFDEYGFLEELKKHVGVKELIDQAEGYRANALPTEINFVTDKVFSDLGNRKNTHKKKSTRVQKALLTTSISSDIVAVGEQVDLLLYIAEAKDSLGSPISLDKITITVNEKVLGGHVLNVDKSELYNILFGFEDINTGKIVCNFKITGEEKPANFEQTNRILIPHKAGKNYKHNIKHVLSLLVCQINDLYKNSPNAYFEVIACSLRSCFELSVKAIEESDNIEFQTVANLPLEDKVYSVHCLMSRTEVITAICPIAFIPSYKNFSNEWKSISSNDINAYIKLAHLGAHGSSDTLTLDRLVGIGNYLGLFLLATDQLLNNSKVQGLVSNEIPVIRLPQ